MEVVVHEPRAEGSVVREYLDFINGLRCIAVLLVVAFHLDLHALSGGFIGVDIFFVISGFLITGICVDERFTFRKFYRSRAMRIFPAYYATLLITTIIGITALLPETTTALSWTTLYSIAFVQNFYFWHAINYFDTGHDNVLLHTWSLAVEWQFYLLLPLLIMMLKRSRPLLVTVLALVALASFAASAIVTDYRPQAAFYLVPFRMWEFLVGGLLVFAPRLRLPSGAGDLLSLVGLLMIAIPAVVFTAATPFPGVAAFYPCAGTALIIYGCQRSGDGLFNKGLSAAPLALLGKASYSIYLVHWPLIILVQYLYVTELPLAIRFIAGAASIIVGIAMWRFVEQPFRIVSPSGRRRPLTQALAPVLPVVALALLGITTQGLPQRFSPQTLDLAAARDEKGAFRRCLEPEVRSQNEFCRFGAAEKTGVDFIVWGDSYADALLEGLDEIAKRSGDAGIFVGTHACPPLLGYPGVSGPSKRRCDELHGRLAELVAETRPREIILHGDWLAYERLDNALFLRSMDETFAWLATLGAKSVVVGLIPGARASVPEAMARASAFDHSVDLAVDHAPSSDVARLSGTVAAEAGKYGLNYVDPVPVLCPGDCQWAIDGKPAYFDAGHLSPLGSRFLIDRLAARDRLLPNP